jgi:protein-L-isoaspartate O-methyltransferase
MSNVTGTDPSPALFFDTISGFERTEALKGAIDLGLFTAIGEGHNTAMAIAVKCKATERGVRILCDYLVVKGFLNKSADQYALTLDSAMFLDSRSPAYLGGAADFLLAPRMAGAYKDIADAVRKGGTLMREEGTVAPEHPLWVKYAQAMSPMIAAPAQRMADLVDPYPGSQLKVLDIAAGSGWYGIAFAQRNPKAEIFAVDWPQVLEVAAENARIAGIEDRYHRIPGSAFEVGFGSGYQLALITNFLHHFDLDTCESLLKKVREALVDDGRCVTLDLIPNEDRVTPPEAASFSLAMLVSTPNGDTYTYLELDHLLRKAGFSRNELQQLSTGGQRIIISYR